MDHELINSLSLTVFSCLLNDSATKRRNTTQLPGPFIFYLGLTSLVNNQNTYATRKCCADIKLRMRAETSFQASSRENCKRKDGGAP